MRQATTKERKMITSKIVKETIEKMEIGHTGIKWGLAVARHDKDWFELGTFGNDEQCASLEQTARNLAYFANSGN